MRAPERRDVVDDPDPASVRREDEVVVARMDLEVADRDVGEVPALELRPRGAAVRRDPEAELGPEEKERRVDRVFLDHVRVSADPVLGPGDPRPGLSEVGRAVGERPHVPEHVEVEGRVSGPRLEPARLDPADPWLLRQSPDVADDVRPVGAAVAGQLQVSVGSSRPDDFRVLRGFADREDVRVFLGGGVVDGDAARFLLLLLFRVMGRQIRRDPIPRLPAVARAEEELRAEVDRPLLRRRGVDRRVPVEMQLLVVAGLRLDVARGPGLPVVAGDVSALRLRVHRVGIGRIGDRPEAVSVGNRRPPGIRDPAGVRGIAEP